MAGRKKTKTADGIRIYCSYAQLVDPSELVTHPKNDNTHSAEQIRAYIEVIEHNGWRRPICVSTLSGYVTRGNGAVQAAIRAGWKQVPVDRQKYDSSEAEIRDLVADNQLARMAQSDQSKLAELLGLLPEDDWPATAMPTDDIAALLDTAADTPPGPGASSSDPQPSAREDRINAANRLVEECGIANGDWFRLDQHVVLMCADAVDAVMCDPFYSVGTPSAVITDPEFFNMNYTGRREVRDRHSETRLPTDDDFAKIQNTLLRTMVGLKRKPGWSVFMFSGWRGIELASRALDRIGKRRMLCVYKKPMGLGNTFRNCAEFVWYYTDGDSYKWNGPKDITNVLEYGRTMSYGQERTPKPIPLLSRLITLSTDRGDVVADPFCGAAPGMIASLDAGRAWCGSDINPVMVALAIIRYAERAETDPFALAASTKRHIDI